MNFIFEKQKLLHTCKISCKYFFLKNVTDIFAKKIFFAYFAFVKTEASIMYLDSMKYF